MAEKSRRVRVKARRWITVAGAVVVLGGGAGVWAATRSSDPAYRLTAAGPAEVASVLSTTGTIQSVNQATLSFPVSGQVSAVNVQVGQQVTQGQVLATLDTTNLATQVSSAQSRTAAAQAKLANDENSQTAAASGGSGASNSGSAGSGSGSGASGGRSGGSSNGGAPGGGKPAGPAPAVTSGQNAVKNAQHQVDVDLSADNTAIGQEKTACAQSTTGQSSSSTATPSSDPSSTTAAPPTASSGSGGSTSECSAQIQQVLDDQSKTASDENSLANAETGLTTALNQAVAATPAGGGSASAPSASAGKGSPSPGSAAKPAGPSAGGKQQAPASAAQLAADQASVDSTNADLAAATQNLSAATLTSPIAGTVAQAGLTAGQSVAGASTQNDIVVIGPGSDEVTTTVNDLQVGQVHTGQSATITPDGTSLRLTGQVTQVGILGSTASSGAVTYPVTISLDQTSQQLFAGATAAVSINAGSSHAAVAVPTSAVHTVGARRFVTVLRNGQVTLAPVTVGVAGTTLTEVRSGLQAGDQVVIADLNAPLPTGTNLRGLGGGGFGGARPGGAGGGARGGGG